MFRNLLNIFADAIWPRCCPVCGRTLVKGEECLCISCLTSLPRTNLHLDDFNAMHHRLGNSVYVHKAMAWFWYYRGNAATEVIIDAKYRDRPKLLRDAASTYTRELMAAGIDPGDFADFIIPAPMHWRKRMSRGYNQAEWVAEGVGRECGLPILRALKATRSHRTQTRLSADERMKNLQGSMALEHSAQLAGRRLLITDDIFTTGATMTAAIATLAAAHPASISILTLGAARKI